MLNKLKWIRLPHCPETQLVKGDNSTDVGYDIFLADNIMVWPYSLMEFDDESQEYKFKLARTGIKLVSDNYDLWYAIYPRSSVYKKGISLINCVGVIDPSYSGELMLTLYSEHKSIFLKKGTRVAQLVIHHRLSQELEEVKTDDRQILRKGGLGSTGA